MEHKTEESGNLQSIQDETGPTGPRAIVDGCGRAACAALCRSSNPAASLMGSGELSPAALVNHLCQQLLCCFQTNFLGHFDIWIKAFCPSQPAELQGIHSEDSKLHETMKKIHPLKKFLCVSRVLMLPGWLWSRAESRGTLVLWFWAGGLQNFSYCIFRLSKQILFKDSSFLSYMCLCLS